MSLWPSNTLAVLFVAAGALSPCVISPFAWGGDKIEFSAPSGSLEVPQPEREDKEAFKTGLRPPAPANAGLTQGDLQASSEILIITTPKRNAVKTRDANSTDSRDSDSTADSRYDNLDSRVRRDAAAQWNLDGKSPFERRTDQPANTDSFRSRLDALDSAGKNDYLKDDRYNADSSDSSEGSRWSRTYYHYGAAGLQRTQEGPFMPFSEEMKAMNEQAIQNNSSPRLSTAPNDLLRDVASRPNALSPFSSGDAARDRLPDETVTTPRTFHPPETRAVSQNSDTFARPDPPPSPRGQVQSRPAILPFPKKPGDVLR
jgi:hypothetical protein